MGILSVKVVEPIVDTMPLYEALAAVTTKGFLLKYQQEFMVKKLRADIKSAQRALKGAQRRLDGFSPPPKRKRKTGPPSSTG
jgi:hypothetical protein